MELCIIRDGKDGGTVHYSDGKARPCLVLYINSPMVEQFRHMRFLLVFMVIRIGTAFRFLVLLAAISLQKHVSGSGRNSMVTDKPCCPELAGLVYSNPICLCTFLRKSETFGVKIDLNRALKLPSICDVETRDFST
ncbi:hypothetical protein HS088_TW22G01256 [Tripterygium wilfordii]|uniref:Bifunctional inhibitor/plant lipid transfer protein/seed storage helical domain-containing protein n=1 Tax=Tripterygium wilfordii TaxID=458696 RepID=A0A7J7C073_TRIWF|nr:hypothetical protein HS088_TW22G01256 [Tripterygium wilfordii]